MLLLISATYLAIGILSYPYWWYSVTATGNTRDFFAEVLGEYFLYNLVFGVILAAIGYAHIKSQSSSNRFVNVINDIVDSKFGNGLVWSLLLIGIARALFVGIDTQQRIYQRHKNTSHDTETGGAQVGPSIKLPIELIYAERTRLADTFGQIQGEMRLTERKLSQKDTVEASGSADGGIAKMEVKGSTEGEKSSTYSAIEPNDAVKLIKTIEYLRDRDKLLLVQSIELQSPELKGLENAVELLATKHSIPIPKLAVENRKKFLIEENLKHSTQKDFPVGSWILIDGKFSISPGQKLTQIRFEYVPSLPSRVTFSCAVPSPEVKVELQQASKEVQSTDMKMFGRISGVNQINSQTQYILSCYAAFR